MNPDSAASNTLRAKAEAKLSTAPNPANGMPADAVLHELQVHQIELEMQNEALREAQEALEESRDRYRDLYEFAPIGYLTLSASGLIEDINLTGARLLGEDRKKLRRRRFARFIAPDEYGTWHRLLLRAIQTGDDQSAEFTLQRNDATVLTGHLECRTQPSAGAQHLLRLTITDVTRLKQAMSELKVREDRLQLAQAATGLGLFDDDFASGTHLYDQRLRELWGFSPDEPVTYRDIVAGVHPEDRAATERLVENACDPQGSGHFAAEYRVINRVTRAVCHVMAIGRVFFEDGCPTRFVGTVKDVSAQKEFEKAMEERRGEMELLVSQQVAAQTAAAIAHELNQPLFSISAYTEAALRMLRTGLKHPDKLARALQGAMEQSQRAGRVLLELFDFLRKGEVVAEPIILNEVVNEALAIAREGGHGRIVADLHLEPDIAPVLGNRLQVQKVLVNLLHNAVDSMGGAGGGHSITMQTIAGEKMARVTVRDSGPGIDAALAHRVFDPFFTTKAGGVGLGLAISRALIEANGGQLWLDPEARPGATFHFCLPYA